MIVAMDAGDHGRNPPPGEQLKAGAGTFFQSEGAFCVLAGVVRHFVPEAAEQIEMRGQELDSRVR